MPGDKRKTPSEASGSRKRCAIGRSTPTNVPASQKKGATLPAGQSSKRPKKYKQWEEVSMLGALKAVSQGMGTNKAVLEFNVPRSTLKDRVSGRVCHGCKSGRARYLTTTEEEELVNYLITCATIGLPQKA